jgi:hypothetical protein
MFFCSHQLFWWKFFSKNKLDWWTQCLRFLSINSISKNFCNFFSFEIGGIVFTTLNNRMSSFVLKLQRFTIIVKCLEKNYSKLLKFTRNRMCWLFQKSITFPKKNRIDYFIPTICISCSIFSFCDLLNNRRKIWSAIS